jgi:hypothetical protein
MRQSPVLSSLVWSSLLIACCVALPANVARAGTFPEPSKYPISWELKFTHGLPKRIVVDLPDKGAVAYWYLPFHVANLGDTEQQFLPTFDMVTNDGTIVHSDFAIPDKVFDAIKDREGNDLLERLPKIAGPIRISEDQSKDGVAIWPEPKDRMGTFNIFIAGLSGEAVQLKDDDGKPKTDVNGSPITLFKTLELDYVIYGDELYPDKDEVTAKGERWVMR